MSECSSNPLVSVFIPTRNRCDLLKRAVSSVQKQTYKNIELVIVDDASTDDTEQVVEKIKKTSRVVIKYLQLEKQRGACAARNHAIRLCSGSFVTGLDDDDIMKPHRINDFLEFYSSKWSFLCTTHIEETDSLCIKSIMQKEVITFDDIKLKNYVGGPIFVNKLKLLEVKGFDEDFVAWQDYDLFFRLIKRFGPAYKIDNHSYVVNKSMSLERITTSNNAHLGYKQFIHKHGKELSSYEINFQKINDLFNRVEKLSIAESLFLIKDRRSFVKIIKLFVLSRWPLLYQKMTMLMTKL